MMENNIVCFMRDVLQYINIKLTSRVYRSNESVSILEQLGGLGYSKLSQRLSRIIYQNRVSAVDCNYSADGIKKLYKSNILNDNSYANALVCIARVIEMDSSLDDTQIYGIVDVISKLGDVCTTGQKRGIIKMVYLLGDRICDVTDGKIKIVEDKDILKRTLDRLFFKARVKVADKLMDKFYIQQGRRKFTDPHMEFFIKRYLNAVYNFNVPVQPGNDPYGVNIERRDLKIFLRDVNLEGAILKEVFEDVRIECIDNIEFYYAVLDWAKAQFGKDVDEDYFPEFLSKNIFYEESKVLRHKAMYLLMENKGYIIDLSMILNKLRQSDSIYKQVEVIIKNKDLLSIRNNEMTLQEYLIMNNDIQTLQVLNKHKCIQIKMRDINGESMLIKACRGAKVGVVSFLLDAGINIDDRAKNGDTALMLACEYNRMDIVKLLVDRKANVNEKGRCNQTALMYACEFKSIECVKYLLNHGADVNAKTKHGSTALIYTFLTYAKNETNNLKITKLLLEHGADVNARGEYGTALVYAVKYWNKDVVKLLLKYGANIKDTDSRGENVLKIASRRGNKEILEVLEKYRSSNKQRI